MTRARQKWWTVPWMVEASWEHSQKRKQCPELLYDKMKKETFMIMSNPKIYPNPMVLFCYSLLIIFGPHSSTFAWKIPWTEEPGRLQSMGSLTVGDDWATSLSLFTFMLWRRKWQPTPVFLPGESQGWGSLVGCRQWGQTELDTTEAT